MIVVHDSYTSTLHLPEWKDPLTLPHEGVDLVLILYQTEQDMRIEAARPSPFGVLVDKINYAVDLTGEYPEVIGATWEENGVPLNPKYKILKWMTAEDAEANGFDVRTEGQIYMQFLLTK